MKRFLRNRRGGASLELALITPILLFLFIGTYDLGFLFYAQSQVETAANAGALLAAKQGFSKFDANAVASATQGASYPLAISLPTAPYMACGCPNGTTGLTPTSCTPPTPACPDALSSAVHYAVVSAQTNTFGILNWGGAYPQTVQAGVVMRLP
jgi:Flp pilus assembly protein TadG